MVSQLSVPYSATRSVTVVDHRPARGARPGRSQAEIVISRFGSVGPSTEQW